MPVAYGDGVVERVRAAAPDGVDGVFDLVGGDALRAVAGLVDPKRLRSVADKPLVRELGGDEVPRDRSTAVLTALVELVAAGELDPHVSEVLPVRRGRGRDARGGGRTRARQGHAAPVSELRWTP